MESAGVDLLATCVSVLRFLCLRSQRARTARMYGSTAEAAKPGGPGRYIMKVEPRIQPMQKIIETGTARPPRAAAWSCGAP